MIGLAGFVRLSLANEARHWFIEAIAEVIDPPRHESEAVLQNEIVLDGKLVSQISTWRGWQEATGAPELTGVWLLVPTLRPLKIHPAILSKAF